MEREEEERFLVLAAATVQETAAATTTATATAAAATTTATTTAAAAAAAASVEHGEMPPLSSELFGPNSQAVYGSVLQCLACTFVNEPMISRCMICGECQYRRSP